MFPGLDLCPLGSSHLQNKTDTAVSWRENWILTKTSLLRITYSMRIENQFLQEFFLYRIGGNVLQFHYEKGDAENKCQCKTVFCLKLYSNKI